MNNQTKFGILFIILILALIVNILLGSVLIPVDEFWNILISSDTHSSYHQIIWEFRLPKSMIALLSGMALGVSGLLMQTLFKNPIVGPYVLGMSSGAGLLVAIFIFGAGLLGFEINNTLSITGVAAIGSILTLALIIVFYYKLQNASSLLIVGLMMGIFSGAIISILSYFSQAEDIQKYVFWSMGNLGNISTDKLKYLTVIVLVFVVSSILLTRNLNALLLGDNYAKSLGISLKHTHFYIILITGILAGSLTAIAGPIAFVGLMVPHITRMVFKTQLHQILLPGVVITGAILMLIFDTIAQLPGSNYTLPINSVTALFGAPLVVVMIFRTYK